MILAVEKKRLETHQTTGLPQTRLFEIVKKQ